MSNHRLLTALAGLGLATAGFLATPAIAPAQSIACGADKTYTVRRGDTLSQIARRAYGSLSRYQFIFSANSGTLANPNIVRVGQVLKIPCTDDITASTADDSVIRTAATTEALPAPEDRTIRVLTASNWAPFLDEDNEHGGMLTEITNVALTRADGNPKFKIDFVNDWGAHLQPLISDHAYDLGIAWFRPNCDVVERLGDGSKFRCNNLNWSEPLFEQIIGYYTRIDHPTPKKHADLFGTKICRPAGYSTFMLEEKLLVAPNVTFTATPGPKKSFEMLLSGECDVIVLATDVSEGAIEELGAVAKVAVHPDLAQVASLHAVISKTHPHGKDILATLDNGIKKIKDDATWFSIVQRHLAEHRSKTK